MLKSGLVALESLIGIIVVLIGTSKIEMTLSATWIELDGKSIRMNGLLVLLGHVVSITKVIESGIMLLVKTDSFKIVLNSLMEITTIAVSITQIVEAFNLLWVNVEGFFVVCDGLADVFQHVLGIGKIVINICNFIIDFDHSLVVLDSILWLSDVIECIGNTNKCLDFLRVMVEGLLEVLASVLGMTTFEKEVTHSDQTLNISRLDSQAFSKIFS